MTKSTLSTIISSKQSAGHPVLLNDGNFQPENGHQILKLHELSSVLTTLPNPPTFKVLDQKPSFYCPTTNRRSHLLDHILSHGHNLWILAGFRVEHNKLVLQFLPKVDATLTCLASKHLSTLQEVYNTHETTTNLLSGILDSIYRGYAIDVEVSNKYKLTISLGEKDGALVSNTRTTFVFTEITAGVAVATYRYQGGKATLTRYR